MQPDGDGLFRQGGEEMKTLILTLATTIVLMIGCGESREGSRSLSFREILTAGELAKASTLTAYDAVRRRRPEFLRPHVPDSIDASGRSAVLPVVYLNGLYHGEVESLRDIPAQKVWEIRYLDATVAGSKYGAGHVAGVIDVTTKIN